MKVRLTDTVGFIRELPHHLVASFRETLEEAWEADVLLHIVDASHPEWKDHIQVVDSVLAELELHDRPEQLVFNKSDRLPDAAGFEARVTQLYDRPVVVNTVTGRAWTRSRRRWRLGRGRRDRRCGWCCRRRTGSGLRRCTGWVRW